jgi:hypothetical protein
MMILRIAVATLIVLLSFFPSSHLLAQDGELTLSVVDEKTGKPLAFRIHLVNQFQRPRKLPRAAFWEDHSTVMSPVKMDLPRGNYFFELECGPEYPYRTGHFTIDRNARDQKSVTMPRIADLGAMGWYAADLDLHRSDRDAPILMAAEQFHVAPLVDIDPSKDAGTIPEERITRTDDGRFLSRYNVQIDAGDSGRLTLFNVREPISLPAEKDRSIVDVLDCLERVRPNTEAWVDLTKATWEDTPLFIGLGLIDSVGIMPRDFGRGGVNYKRAPEGREVDQAAWGGVHGHGRWIQHVYYQLLECGIELPPTAGTGSGVVSNPAAYNRTYTHVEGELTYDKWWQSLASGQCVVTNGPLLLAKVNGRDPGAVFSGTENDPMSFKFALTLHTRDQIDYFEVIKNGQVVRTLRLEEFAQQAGEIPPVEFTESGWFLLRAVCTEPKTYRFVSTAPFYVHMGRDLRVSRSAVKFFQDWLEERAVVLLDETKDADDRQKLEEYLARARQFWQAKSEAANVD